jgi:hypothetical protein
MTSRLVISSRHVQGPDGVGAVAAVGELPHPLLGHDVDVLGVLRRRRIPDVIFEPLHEPEQEEEQRHADHDELEAHARHDHRGRLLRAALAVLEEEEERHQAGDRRGDHGHRDDEEMQAVDGNGEGRAGIRQPKQPAHEIV